jgi:hypothetical protein
MSPDDLRNRQSFQLSHAMLPTNFTLQFPFKVFSLKLHNKNVNLKLVTAYYANVKPLTSLHSFDFCFGVVDALRLTSMSQALLVISVEFFPALLDYH